MRARKLVSVAAVLLNLLFGAPGRALAIDQAGDSVPEPHHPLVWDQIELTAQTDSTRLQHEFVFTVTNTGQTPVTIQGIFPSCSCTEVISPTFPVTLAPDRAGVITANLTFAGKVGILRKSLFVQSDAGPQKLRMILTVRPASRVSDIQRKENQQVALADRQAVFRGDCAGCHFAPAKGKSGAELYQAVCAICHDSENRASIVPDLFSSHGTQDKKTLLLRIAEGKKDSLMPAFAESAGGPLNDQQISSLLPYLTDR